MFLADAPDAASYVPSDERVSKGLAAERTYSGVLSAIEAQYRFFSYGDAMLLDRLRP